MHLEFLVEKMKEIVILMMSVNMVFHVDQTIAQLHSVLTLKLIAVIVEIKKTTENTSSINQNRLTEERKIIEQIVSLNNQGIWPKKTEYQDLDPSILAEKMKYCLILILKNIQFLNTLGIWVKNIKWQD